MIYLPSEVQMGNKRRKYERGHDCLAVEGGEDELCVPVLVSSRKGEGLFGLRL